MPFTLAGWATGSSPSGPRETSEWFPDPLVGFGSSSEAAQAPSRCPEPPVPRDARRPAFAVRQLAAPPLRFRPLQRLPSTEQRHEMVGIAPRPPAPSGYRNLLAPSSAPSLPALFHAGSALGVTLQSFIPPAQPYAVSSAAPLLALPPPSGFCSTRESATRSSCLG
jgi:hypothetical protein